MPNSHIPPAVQRAIGQTFKKVLGTIQDRYGVSEEDSLLVMLALVHGYATGGGFTTDQLSTMAFRVWAAHDGLAKTPQ